MVRKLVCKCKVILNIIMSNWIYLGVLFVNKLNFVIKWDIMYVICFKIRENILWKIRFYFWKCIILWINMLDKNIYMDISLIFLFYYCNLVYYKNR